MKIDSKTLKPPLKKAKKEAKIEFTLTVKGVLDLKEAVEDWGYDYGDLKGNSPEEKLVDLLSGNEDALTMFLSDCLVEDMEWDLDTGSDIPPEAVAASKAGLSKIERELTA